MYLAAYHFSGPSADLLAKHDALDIIRSDRLTFHLCVATEDGISVYDACPSREVFAQFSTDATFLDDLRRVGLPAPRIEGIGDIHSTVPALA